MEFLNSTDLHSNRYFLLPERKSDVMTLIGYMKKGNISAASFVY
ncbi:hypothetical protein [Turicimonas sp. TL08]